MNKQQKNKKSGFSWGILIILIPILMNMLDGDVSPAVVAFLIIAAVVAVILSGVKKKKEAAAKQALERRAAAPAQPVVQTSRPVPAMQRREPAAPAQRSFPQPDAYCVSCELSGEDHFVRDRQRRIAQLDEWLKNGLIDRQEYLVLKRRFENDQ